MKNKASPTRDRGSAAQFFLWLFVLECDFVDFCDRLAVPDLQPISES